MPNVRDQIRLTDDETRDFLASSKTVIVGTNNHDGYPHLVPMWYSMLDGLVHMHTYKSSQKVKNVERDARGSILVEGAGFSAVRSLVGHGVGRSYHEDPQIPNYGPPGRGPLLQEGMTLAIEPMITAGEPDVYVHADEWSISSVDESLAAHFEHTVAVTADGPRVLTLAKAPLLR